MLKRPCFVLAPMADVTDAAFRRVIARYGKPDVMWTEFVSADGLYHTRELLKYDDEHNPLMKDLQYDHSERPIVAQLFSSSPDMMEYGARVVHELGFDGVDINMGCPDRSVEKQGSGAALIKEPALARDLIRAAKRGVRGELPVSVKTRTGYSTVVLKSWLSELLSEEPAVITVHARTRKEMSKVSARWEHVKDAVQLRDQLGSDTLILGNGDVTSLAGARQKVAETGADGVMIGRGIFGNPWLWSERVPSVSERLAVLGQHCELFEELCPHKSFAVMKKHIKAYVRDFPGAHEMRVELMKCANAAEMRDVINIWTVKV